uniref:DUF2007 domain-containing protein n=1 Tax=Gelidibacter sp. TaxID=2018083 RepID=UPI00404B2ECC
MNDSEYIKIFSGSFIVAQLIVDRLHNIGINAIVKDESESGRLAGFASSIQDYQELYVNKEEAEYAIPAVEAVKDELEIM